jgi:hypothetical protein
MTATPAKYRPRFYSEVIREVGSPDDCVICASLTLYDAATLGEGVTRNDGRSMDTIALRELRDNAGLKPDGSLRLNDAAQYLDFVSTRAGLTPPFKLDYYPGHPGGTLRVTWDEFRTKVRNGYVAILLGNPIGVSDPTSPLRTMQNNDDYGHAIAVMDGNANGALVFDALNRKPPTFGGVRVGWDDLRQFTEAKKNGERLYGTPVTVACAMEKVGEQTEAARIERKAAASLERIARQRDAQKAQTALATDERDQARRELAASQKAYQSAMDALAAANTALDECRARPTDCAEETDRAIAAERKVADAIAVLTR